MEVDVRQDRAGVDWKAVSDTFKSVGMVLFKKGKAMFHRTCISKDYGYHSNKLVHLFF